MEKISTSNQTVNTEAFNTNFDKIFGVKKSAKGSYIQDPETGKLVPRGEYVAPRVNHTTVHADMQPVHSPITGEIITCRGKLAEHNRRHGVTNAADYSPQFLETRRNSLAAEHNAKMKRSRIDDIQTAICQHVSYY